MAQGRRRPARSTRGGRRSGGGLPWLLLAVFVLVGAAVVAARTVGRTGTERFHSVEPTLTVLPAATSAPAAGRASEPIAAPAPPRTPAPTAARVQLTATPRPGATVGVVVATSTSTPSATVSTGVPATATPPAAPTRATGGVGSVALTFDAGADRGFAEDILDVLHEEHVVASFGVTGQWARANAELVRRMAADGHLVMNHTLDHRSFTGLSDRHGGLSPDARRAELEDADAIIAPLIGHSTRPFYRLPYGDDDARVAADVLPAGYSHKVGWTVDSLGWRGTSSGDIVARCLGLAAPGGVYVFHVGRASQDAVALPRIIRGLRDRGLGFRRVDQ